MGRSQIVARTLIPVVSCIGVVAALFGTAPTLANRGDVCYVVDPAAVVLQAGQPATFAFQRGDRFVSECYDLQPRRAIWTATGGIVASNGNGQTAAYHADVAGSYQVTATQVNDPGHVATATARVFPETTVYAFPGGAGGAGPRGGVLIAADGGMFGVTDEGGNTNTGKCLQSTCGTVFELVPEGSGFSATVIHRFHGADGANPQAGLIVERSGKLFGTTSGGGTAAGAGTVFELARAGSAYTARVIHRFGSAGDGSDPEASLLEDSRGDLFGTTRAGGGACSCGVIFELTPYLGGYREQVLYRFQGGMDGADPRAALIADRNGNLFGTTYGGGGGTTCLNGCGTLLMLVHGRSGYQESVLHRFAGGHADGAHPQASLYEGLEGALAGTTRSGGRGYCPDGCGVVFRYSRLGERIVHDFAGRTAGALPRSNVIVYSNGEMFGATYASGVRTGRFYGTVYQLTLKQGAYTLTTLYSFGTTQPDGQNPEGSLVLDRSGNLVGTTVAGGAGYGTVFRVAL
jgi:uncharacterized repeat protein (TIGR03803 family)